MMKIVAIGCICLCVLVIAYALVVYFELPSLKPTKKEKNQRIRY